MKRKGYISIIFIIALFIYFSFIRIELKEETKWSPPVSDLTWGMSMEEVEKRYDLDYEEAAQVKEYKVIPMSEIQMLYGQEMQVYLYFSTLGTDGLARMVGYFDKAQEEVLFEQLRERYGGYEKYWNNQHVEEVYTKDQIKQAYDNLLEGEELGDTMLEAMGKKPLCYIKLGEAENGKCAFIMDATMEVLMGTK